MKSSTKIRGWPLWGGSNPKKYSLWSPEWNDISYPDYTYSRTQSATIADNSTNGLWAANGINGNIVTLRNPWPAQFGTISAGTAVRNTQSGSNYKYIAGSNVEIPGTWTQFSGWIGNTDPSGANTNNGFPNYTSFIKMIFLLNRNVIGNATNISSVSFSQMQPLQKQSFTGNSAGSPGMYSFDVNYMYICTAPNTWKRIALTAF